MREGLYELRFKTPTDEGRGLVTVQGGQLLGGDAIIIYVGTYAIEGERFIAYVQTHRYATEPGMSSLFGRDDVRVDISGSIRGDSMTGHGQLPDAPGIRLSVHLRRVPP